jgi:hypothetical protein
MLRHHLRHFPTRCVTFARATLITLTVCVATAPASAQDTRSLTLRDVLDSTLTHHPLAEAADARPAPREARDRPLARSATCATSAWRRAVPGRQHGCSDAARRGHPTAAALSSIVKGTAGARRDAGARGGPGAARRRHTSRSMRRALRPPTPARWRRAARDLTA